MIRLRELFWRWVIMIPKSIAAVKPGRILITTHQRLAGAGVHGNVRSAKLGRIQSISGGPRYIDIPGDHGNCRNPNIRRTQRHAQRDRIIGSGVGINQKSARHARSISDALSV